MRILLDSHLLLWVLSGVLSGSRRLPREAKRLLDDDGNETFVSAASIREIAIKSGLSGEDFKVEFAPPEGNIAIFICFLN